MNELLHRIVPEKVGWTSYGKVHSIPLKVERAPRRFISVHHDREDTDIFCRGQIELYTSWPRPKAGGMVELKS